MKKYIIVTAFLTLTMGVIYFWRNRVLTTPVSLVLLYDKNILNDNCVIRWKTFCIGKGDFYKSNPEIEHLEEELRATQVAVTLEAHKHKSSISASQIKYSGASPEIINMVFSRMGLWTPQLKLEHDDTFDPQLWLDGRPIPIVSESFEHPELARLKTYYYLRYHEKALQLLRIEYFKNEAREQRISFDQLEKNIYNKWNSEKGSDISHETQKPNELFWSEYFLKNIITSSKTPIRTALPRPQFQLQSPDKSWSLLKGKNRPIVMYDNITDSFAVRHRIELLKWAETHEQTLHYIPVLSAQQTLAWTFFRIALCMERKHKGFLKETLTKLERWPQSDSELRSFFANTSFSVALDSSTIDRCSTHTKDDDYLKYYSRFADYAHIKVSPVIALNGFVFAQKVPENYFWFFPHKL